MQRLTRGVALFLLIAAAPFTPAAAQSVGMAVTDVNGGAVGTVTAVNGDVVTVKTDRLEANLPKASFTAHEGKLLVGMTRTELNAAIEKDKAAAEASLAVGAPIKGSAGATLGTIDAIDAEFLTLKLTSGKLVRLPRASVAGSADGALIGMTAAQLEAQVGGDAPAQ